MAYLKISLVVAALLASMGVAGFNSRNSSSAAPGAQTIGEQVWNGPGGGTSEIFCTVCN